MKQLEIKDLLEGELNSNGFGLYKHEVRQAYFWRKLPSPYDTLRDLDLSILAVAEHLELSALDLQDFMDSRFGRHCGDELTYTNNYHDFCKVLNRYMTDFMNSLHELPDQK